MGFLRLVFGWLTGGTLDRVLKTVEHRVDNETERQRIGADLAIEFGRQHIEARANMMQFRVFWFVWGLFAVPLGLWWALVMADTFLPVVSLRIPDLPSSVKPWADQIFWSVFGSGGGVASVQALSGAIRARR